MAEAYLIGVNTPRGDSGITERRLFVILDDSPDKALGVVQSLCPNSRVELTGIPVLPETVQKLGLVPGYPKQL